MRSSRSTSKWMTEFARAYRDEIGIPFECYTHPQTMTRDMARLLAEAGCIMVRVGVQSVNSDTWRPSTARAIARRSSDLRFLAEYGVPVFGRPHHRPPWRGGRRSARRAPFLRRGRAEADRDPLDDLLPGTTALEQARTRGILDDADIERILDGEVGPGYMFGGNKEYRDHGRAAASLGRVRPAAALPRARPQFLLEKRRYRHLRGAGLMRQLGTLALAARASRRRASTCATSWPRRSTRPVKRCEGSSVRARSHPEPRRRSFLDNVGCRALHPAQWPGCC
jgi:hypothetical protein